MIAAIQAHVPEATVHGAAAGLHLMITFDSDISDINLATACLSAGVKVQPLSWHRQVSRHSQRKSLPGLVLGYAARTQSDINEGISIIGMALRNG